MPNSTEGRMTQMKTRLPVRPPPVTGAMVDYWLVARVCLHCFSRGENEAEADLQILEWMERAEADLQNFTR